MMSKLIHNVTVLLTLIQYLLSSRPPLYISNWMDSLCQKTMLTTEDKFSAQINISCAQVSLKNIFLCPTCTPYIYTCIIISTF